MMRREFIRSVERLAAGALCAGLPALTLACTGIRYVYSELDGNRLVVRRADLGAETHALLEHPRIPRAVYLRHVSGDSFTAVLTRCTHMGCQVEPVGDRLACPCHGSEYRPTGEVLRGPAERSLQQYAVTADSERIYIELSDVP